MWSLETVAVERLAREAEQAAQAQLELEQGGRLEVAAPALAMVEREEPPAREVALV